MYRKEEVEVEGSPMGCLLFAPQGRGPFPGVVVAQHLPVAHAGLEKDPFTLDVGERLAAAGFACVIPWLFHWWPPEADVKVKRERFRDDWTLADLDAAFTLLAGQAAVDGARIGILGHCWGGRVALLGACRDPRYRAAVVLYGGRIKLPMGPASVAPIALVDRIACPVLGIFGNDDESPSPADVDDLEAALARAGVAHELHRYDGAGHGFQDHTSPERYHAAAAEDAWAKLLGFLGRQLRVARS